MTRAPLRYRISDWHQLPACKSNTSQKLHIKVVDYFDKDVLNGIGIQVVHDLYGVLFAEVVNASGLIINIPDVTSAEGAFELEPETILKELNKFGFSIKYNHKNTLPEKQLEFLKTLKGLGYDKIRIMNYWYFENGSKQTRLVLVAFNVSKHGQWLNNGYAPSKDEFMEALMDGTASNLTDVGEARYFVWDWLDYVANIDDILRDNEKVE